MRGLCFATVKTAPNNTRIFMKNIMVTFLSLLMIQSIALAQDSGYRKLTDSEQSNYSRSLVNALAGQVNDSCMGVIQQGLEMYIQKNSAQPLIIAVDKTANNSIKKVVKITTDSTYKKIINVEGELSYETTQSLEKGNFLNPNLVEENVTLKVNLHCRY